ncbi:MAG TPA: hypothetical protein VHR45_01315 [Thermoanaerobaculia bacterium]|nr:hypothetical protein [Thermoanaerobaculia bacterium]
MEPRMNAALAATLFLLSAAGGNAAQGPDRADPGSGLEGVSQPTVHAIYLVPSDTAAKPAYAFAVRNAVLDLQSWYQRQMGGITFRLADPVVQTITLPHPAAFYATGDSLGFWNSTLHDAFALTGGGFFDPSNVWLFYADADPACGQATGGTSGVALVPANDLRGLSGETTKDGCGGPPGNQYPVSRWIGGLGHEAGHAFNLPHPPGCDTGQASCDSKALMWLGFYDYPDTYLNAAEIDQLKHSPFFLPGICSSSTTILCQSSARFQTTAMWKTADGHQGIAQSVQLTTDTGYFWFFGTTNIEMVVKVLDGCGLGGHFWVFAGGLTNVQVTMTVRDTQTGRVKIYVNPANTTFQPIQDTSALSCGAASSANGSPGAVEAAVKAEAQALNELVEQTAAAPASPPEESFTDASACAAGPTALCLGNNRFKVEATFQSGAQSGQAQVVPLTADTGYLWFFGASNVEAVVKVINGCGFSNHFWFFAGGLTNVNVVVKVTDTQTGTVKTYTNPANTTFLPIQDTSAFSTCP